MVPACWHLHGPKPHAQRAGSSEGSKGFLSGCAAPQTFLAAALWPKGFDQMGDTEMSPLGDGEGRIETLVLCPQQAVAQVKRISLRFM